MINHVDNISNTYVNENETNVYKYINILNLAIQFVLWLLKCFQIKK